MTSYPVCNKTSLSRKTCIPDKKLLCNAIRKSWSLNHNPSRTISCSAPWRSTDDDVISDWQILLPRKPCIADITLLWITIRMSWSLFQSPLKKSPEASPGGEIIITSYPACHKTTLSWKLCMAAKKLLLVTIMKSWSVFQHAS